MSTPTLELAAASDLVDRANAVIDAALHQLAERGGVDAQQTLAYDIAHAASALATAKSCLAYAAKGTEESQLVAAFIGIALGDLATRVLGREALWGVDEGWFAPFAS